MATATPGQSWPTDGGQHIDVMHLTTVDMQNSSSYRQLKALHGNGVVLGACIPNRRSILEHRTDETTALPLNKVSRSGTMSQVFQQKSFELDLSNDVAHMVWPGESARYPNTNMSSRPRQGNNTAWQGQGWTRCISRSMVLAWDEHVCRLRGVKCGTPVASPGIERTDVFFQTTARLISADAIATVIQESIVGKQSKLEETTLGLSRKYRIKSRGPRTEPWPLGNSWRDRLKWWLTAIDAGADAALTQVTNKPGELLGLHADSGGRDCFGVGCFEVVHSELHSSLR